MRLEFRDLHIEKAPEAKLVRQRVKTASGQLLLPGFEIQKIFIQCRFLLDRSDQREGYVLGTDNGPRAWQVMGAPQLSAVYQTLEDSVTGVTFQQKWRMLGTEVRLDRGLPHQSPSLAVLYDCCKTIQQFYRTVMPAFGKSSGSMAFTLQGRWMREGSSKPLVAEFATKSITEGGSPTYGLPAANKSQRSDSLTAKPYPESGGK